FRPGPGRTWSASLLGSEAIEQPVTAGAAQVALAASALRSARGMRRVPRPRRRVVAQPLAIDMADHGRALGAARPVLAGAILGGRERAAFRGRAGQHVVTVRCEAHARDGEAALADRVVEAELVVVAVQIVDAGCNDRAFEVLPRTFADAVTGVDGRLAGGL